MRRKVSSQKFKYRMLKAFGMDFLRVSSQDNEVSVSVRMVRRHSTKYELMYCLHKFLIELHRS